MVGTSGRVWMVAMLFTLSGSLVAMERWTAEHRAYVVETFFRNNDSVILTQRSFRIRFNVPPRGAIPSRNTILLWVRNFQNTAFGTTRRRGGSRRTVRTPANIEAVRHAVERSPRRSAILHAQALRISDRSVRRILHDDLSFHPYKIATVQELQAFDFERRLNFAQTMLRMIDEDPGIIVLSSDEAHFHLNGCVNKQNFRYWAPTNPQELHQQPLHCERVTVWAAVCRSTVLGPYFFEENGQTVTVNSARYVAMIRDFLIPELRRHRIPLRRVWFQQDGATAHTSRASMAQLRGFFPGKLISLRGDIEWPARSPDLSPCDFYLWGYLKGRVYVDRPNNLNQLKENIRREIREIPRQTLERVMTNFSRRLVQCRENGGHHLSDIIFAT